jgi:hypothetical protein
VSFVTPTVVSNGAFRCARPVHFERNNGQVGVFCDGSFSGFVNSSVFVIDESAVTDTNGENPIVFNQTILGSHHGVAVPVNDNHLLHSVAAPERINRSGNASDYTLPSFFEIVDMASGAVLHQLNDTGSLDTHCAGYHGAAYFENTIILACDDSHGGVVIVNYSEATDVYTSRALLYPSPTTFDGHRSAHFEQHKKSDYIIGDFNDGEETFSLIAFQASDTTLTDMNVLPLSTLQCGFAYEKSAGEVILILMPDGMLYSYEFDSATGWMKIAELLVVESMTACSEAIFVVGYVHAFVIVTDETPTIYAVDLHHVHEGEMTYTTSSIDFTPYSAVVGGVPPLVACSFEAHDHDHDHDHGDDENKSNQTNNTGGGSGNNSTSMSEKSRSVKIQNFAMTILAVAIMVVFQMM